MATTLTPELRRACDFFLESRHGEFETLGTQYFQTFGADKGAVSSQVRYLQQLVCATTRFTDIGDFVKNQMGRKSGGQGPWRTVGDPTLEQLRELREKAEELTDGQDAEISWQVRLHLARGWVRAVVSHYLYEKALGEMENAHGKD